MKIWETIDVPKTIEFVSYAHENDCQEVLKLIESAFYRFETVSVSSGICDNDEALEEMLKFCEKLLGETNVAIVARDVDKNKIVGFSFNLILAKPTSNEPDDFEIFRKTCKTKNARCFTEFIIAAESKIDKFEHYNVNAVLEMMYVMVSPEYNGKGIASNLVKASLHLATDLKNGINCEEFLLPGQPRPELVTTIWSVRGTQKIGQKLGFEVFSEEPFTNYSFEGKTFAEHAGDQTLTGQVAAKRI